MPSYHLHIQGQVQGVGFRPYAYQLANKLALTGWASNDNDGVHIQINGSESACEKFIAEIIQQPPKQARVTTHQVLRVDDEISNREFIIRESSRESKPTLSITPDLGVCDSCRREIANSFYRRHNYAFTTCLECGPRYSIMQALPYDRNNTAMAKFEQCVSCEREYNNPLSHRHYSQTNSCPHCGVTMTLCDSEGKELTTDSDQIISEVPALLANGKIIALKGIGGYLLIADATQSLPIELLRTRKHRPTKPLALLYPNVEMVRADAFLSESEARELQSIESPIVLVNVKENPASGICTELIAPSLGKIGVMLPYSPLLELLASAFGKPMIATSGNMSGSPIIFQDRQAFKYLASVADYFVTNNRDIVVPQDDSVVQFTQDRQRIVLRRSRGFAPTYLPNPFKNKKNAVLATGGELKSAFALLNHGQLYVSQYLGDLESYETQESYRHVQEHLLKLLQAKPSKVLVDSHPAYFSSQIGKELARTWETPLKKVQHHKAHFSAVLAENNLMDAGRPVLGVIWDGTGWGEDGHVWGGEFFVFKNRIFDRVTHLPYFDHLLGDKSSREPRLSALSLCEGIPGAQALLRAKFTEKEWNIYNVMLTRDHNMMTSSVGRLFDGVASLLGLCDKSTYEGEAAMALEACAAKAPAEIVPSKASAKFDLKKWMSGFVAEIQAGVPKELLAFRFHVAMVNWIEEIAIQTQVDRLAFSGGVFQNALLVELIRKRLGHQFELYFHKQLSPNDECVGFGQLAYDQIMIERMTSHREVHHEPDSLQENK
jgi:hydrogenase maturation protein HypF